MYKYKYIYRWSRIRLANIVFTKLYKKRKKRIISFKNTIK